MQSLGKRTVPCFEFPRLGLVSDSFEVSNEANCSLFLSASSILSSLDFIVKN